MRTRRVFFEPLEDRRVLATFIVSSLDDSAVTMADELPGSLRQAIFDANAANGADEIQYQGDAAAGTIELTAGQLEISDDLTIAGPGKGSLTIDADSKARAFQIGPGVTASISGLTITGGRATGTAPDNYGGGIYNDHGTLTVSGVHFINGQADFGGGIFNDGKDGSATSTILGSTFAGNQASE